MNLFEPSNKVIYLKKLVIGSGVRFLILFVLTDAILLNLDLQKSPSLKVGFDLVESIGFDHRFLKLVALV